MIRFADCSPLIRTACVALLGLLFAAAPVQAAPFDVTFDGVELNFGGDLRNWGVGAMSVQNYEDAGGVVLPIHPQLVEALFDFGGPLDIDQALRNPGMIDPIANPTVDAQSDWTATNVTSDPVTGTNFLLFVTVERDPTSFLNPNPYLGPETTLNLDTNSWVLFELEFMMGQDLVSIFYPAIAFSDLGPGDDFTFLVDYEVGIDLPIGTNGGDPAHYLPPFRLMMLNEGAIIPEPATAALLAFGLLGIASRRKQVL